MKVRVIYNAILTAPGRASFVVRLIIIGLSLMFSAQALSNSPSVSPIIVSQDISGERLDQHFTLLHDPTGQQVLTDIQQLWQQGKFTQPSNTGSTGLQLGAYWIAFSLQNPAPSEQRIIVEYVDHQLITLQAYSRRDAAVEYQQIADVSLDRPFSERVIAHHRFAFTAELAAGETQHFFVKLGSKGKGFVFPNLRLWSDSAFANFTDLETGGMAFLFGGFFIVALLALVAGVSSHEKFFFAYAIYCLSKIIAWSTIFGLTHRFILTDNFHWSYMSVSGGLSIFCGLVFSRMFLQTKQFTPKLDRVLVLMQLNAVVLIIGALLHIKALALISITLALLLYPVNFFAGVLRLRQGSKEAGVFALAWGFIMLGLGVQAFRDLGFVPHNLFNYYWPFFASYTEVMVIMAAMGLKVRRIRLQKDIAENKYTEQLERSTAELERQVAERTRQLEKAKRAAEIEANTDALTGTRNRRSFMSDSDALLQRARLTDITFSLLMFDIDNFKDINDKFGHQTGDIALKAFAELVNHHIRDSDIFGRLGGEEFSLLVCGDKENAVRLAERLRSEVSELTIDTDNGPLTFTTSIGIAHQTDKQLLEDLINQADKALYQAKQAGRNKVIEG
ncbi:sensor domain-containing diguanylate cyclase [Aestuariibacter salexigens]|uniref:sensor domain-containing diguanylate cyclase n=1 Tax=Aestuariibacter salexigens TaxID=226010 RepID=UPI0006866424|nr:diguanylate cyclase [Aestuariibacter salexigens]